MTQQMCRCCLNKDISSPRILIKSKSLYGDRKTLEDYLNTLFNYSNHQDIEYPNQICLRCYKALEVAYHFVFMSFENKWKFEELWKLKKEAEKITSKATITTVANTANMGNPMNMESKVAPIQLTILQMDQSNYKVTMETREETQMNIIKEDGEVKAKEDFKTEQSNKEAWTNNLLPSNSDTVAKSSASYKCRYCPETADRHELLIHHTLKEHKYLIPFKCQMCTFISCNHDSLAKHYKGVHKLDNVDERLYRKHELLAISAEDITKHHNTFQCKQCEYQSNILTEMDQHLITEHDIQEDKDNQVITFYNCPKCHRQFTDETAAKIHYTKNHNMQPIQQTQTFTCQKCGTSFDLKSSLTSHERVCEIREPVICNFCQQQFFSVQKYEQHIQNIHSVVVKYECEICEKSFKSPAYLSAHRKRHNARHWHCELCPKNYINHAELKVHMQRIHKIHKSESVEKVESNKEKLPVRSAPRKTIKCEYCTFTTSFKFAMNVHLCKHTGKPYKCKICPKEFVFKKSIKDHCRRIHALDITDSELALMFKEKYGYPSRFDAFSERNNNLQIEEIDVLEMDLELQAYNLNLDDIMHDVFESK